MTKVLDNLEEFRSAVGQVQLSTTQDYLEVSERLFNFLTPNDKKTEFLTYGSPGVKVFRQGTRKECEDNLLLSAEAFHDKETRRKQNASR